MTLGDRQRAALRRDGYSAEEIAELEADVRAGKALVVLERGEARVIGGLGIIRASEDRPERSPNGDAG